MPLKEYKPGSAFTGVIGRTFDRSQPAWPEPPRAKEGNPGRGQLYIDGKLVGQTVYPHTTPLSMGLTGGWTVGDDPGALASPYYDSPDPFTGMIYNGTIDVSSEVIEDKEAGFKRLFARQ